MYLTILFIALFSEHIPSKNNIFIAIRNYTVVLIIQLSEKHPPLGCFSLSCY